MPMHSQTILQIAAEAGDLDTTNIIINTLEDKMEDAWAGFLNHKDMYGRRTTPNPHQRDSQKRWVGGGGLAIYHTVPHGE